MKKIFKVLLIDNHPLILEIYEIALIKASLVIDNTAFEIETAKNSEIAMQKNSAGFKIGWF